VHKLFIHFEKAYDSARIEIFYNILIEFYVTIKLVRIIKMYLNKPYSKVLIGKTMTDAFPVQSGLTQGDTFITIDFQL